MAELLKASFRRELLKAELDLGQRRYGAHYWDPEMGAVGLAELERARVALLNRLNVEMNDLLNQMCPGETGEPIHLSPIFSEEFPAPNLEKLTSVSRQKFETWLWAGLTSGATAIDADMMQASARDALSADEFAGYLRWNSPEVATLRNELVGFHATESEFAEILRWRQLVDSGGPETADTLQAEITLEDRIGSARLTALIQQRNPELQTASQDLRRLGLPVERAAWLANFRRQGILEIQKLWSDPALPSDAKAARVAQLQRSYRTLIAATLALPENRVAGIDLMP
jgi:hypothetical protein